MNEAEASPSEKNDEKNTDSILYEVGFHLIPSILEDSLSKETAAITAVIEKEGGTIVHLEPPVVKQLAYRLEKTVGGKKQHFESAYFGWTSFRADREALSGINSGLKLLPPILRYLIIETVPEAYEKRERRVTGRIERPDYREMRKTDSPSATPISEEELDKTIEKLIAE